MAWIYDEINDNWIVDEICPNCRRPYDEIDFEYQICHFCKYDNSKPNTDEKENEYQPS